MDARSIDYPAIPEYMPGRPICQSIDPSTNRLHQLETRSGSHPLRRAHNALGPPKGICLSTIQSHSEILAEGNGRTNGVSTRSSSVASPTQVARSTQTISSSSSSAPKLPNPVERPSSSKEGSPNVSPAPPCRILHLSKRFQSAEGFPPEVSSLLMQYIWIKLETLVRLV